MATHHSSLNDVFSLKYIISCFCYKLFRVTLMAYTLKIIPADIIETVKHHSDMEQTLSEHHFRSNNASINFIQNHPPPPPQGHDLKGAKTLPPGQLLCTKTLPSGQNRESNAPPLRHKVRQFHKCVRP